jgi:hypothetical protein
LFLCIREEKFAGQGRPREFAADEQTGLGLATLERVKGADQGDAKPGKDDTKKDFAQEDWNQLTGTWGTPFKLSLGGKTQQRMRLEFRDSGKDRLFVADDEIKTGAGQTEKYPLHSAVLVVKSLGEEKGKRYLIVTPQSTPLRPEFDQRIRYEFGDGQLRLEGRLGTRDLTWTWSRVVGNR